MVDTSSLAPIWSAPLTNSPRASPSFLLAEFCCCRSKNEATVRWRQHSTNVQPVRKMVISLKHVQSQIILPVRSRIKQWTSTGHLGCFPCSPTGRFKILCLGCPKINVLVKNFNSDLLISLIHSFLISLD